MSEEIQDTVKPANEIVPQQNKSMIDVSSDGIVNPKNVDELFRVAAAFLKSGMLPSRYKTVESVITAWQYARELGLKPLVGMKNIAVINGAPVLFGEGPMSLVYRSGLVESHREYFLNADQKEICAENGNLNDEPFSAVVVTKRKGDASEFKTSFSIEDAKRADLLKNPTWKKYPKVMMQYKARGHALRTKYPDAIGGISQAEYDFDTIIGDDKAPVKTRRESELI